ncbi:MAG: ferritin-like domain-containing protein [Alphaproteobacteria bacterium]|nr:ferritin-like domain-containing protein [Alphaproteobacteria bacterium]
MTPIERLLAAQVVLVLTGCGPSPEQAARWCDEGPPGDRFVAEGTLTVPLGAECPAVEDVESLSGPGCPSSPFTGVVCAFVSKSEDMVATGYGGYAPAGGSGGFGFGDPVDVCTYTGVFEPRTGNTVCGRPLLRDGRPVVAAVASRADWQADPVPSVDPATRSQHGATWLRLARLEHASVASFARFTLELVRFGAPPELLLGAQRAGLDEVEHARLCFALASAYLGEAVGPSEVDLAGAATLAPDRLAFAEALVREGCVGETLSVLEAAAMLAGTSDPAVADVLRTIIDDESRHAALAWKTLAWLLASDDGTLEAHVSSVLEAERARPIPVHVREGFDRVVVPAWRALTMDTHA